MVKAHCNIRTCTWWQIPLLQVQPAPLIQDSSGQMLTCRPSAQHKQQTRCSWWVSKLHVHVPWSQSLSVCNPTCQGDKRAAHLHITAAAGPTQKTSIRLIRQKLHGSCEWFLSKSSQTAIEEAPDFSGLLLKIRAAFLEMLCTVRAD